jgi:uncharacterized protein YeeX (DUF496 family)
MVTTILFDTSYSFLFKNSDVKKALLLDNYNYVPAGATSLYDAIGKAINEELDYLGTTPKKERPEKTMVIILTDGEENSSREFSKDQIKNLINEMKEDYKWEFIFLAANQDAALSAESIGINKDNSMNFMANSDGTRGVYDTISRSASSYRKGTYTTLKNLVNEEEK